MPEKNIYVNLIVVTGLTRNAVTTSGIFLSNVYGRDNIKRMSFVNMTGVAQIDNTGSEYFYDEVHNVMRDTIVGMGEGEKLPALVCQITTKKEIVLDNLLAIQNNIPSEPLTATNRWHMKHEAVRDNKIEADRVTMTHSAYKAAGYMSIWNGEVQINERVDENSDVHIPNFVRECGIDAFKRCPKCRELTSAAQIAIKGACLDCSFGTTGKLRGALIRDCIIEP